MTRIRSWWNAILILRVKHAATNVAVIVLLVVGFQVQNARLNAADIKNNKANIDAIEASIALHHYEDDVHAYSDCTHRVSGRNDLRIVLFSMVDLATVFPDSPTAILYTQHQKALIESAYPPLDKSDCGPEPIKPQGTP